jgi:ABC-type antimicrobial peptide transport system permease subunit
MKSSETTRSAHGFGHNTLILSLAGAVLISAAGFGLIFLFAAWLIPKSMMWQNTHHYSAIFSVVILMFVVLSSAMIRAARKKRSAE